LERLEGRGVRYEMVVQAGDGETVVEMTKEEWDRFWFGTDAEAMMLMNAPLEFGEDDE